jgi:hypothetical protein
MPGRGVGRTGAPAAVIHDFCRAPPKNVFRVALDVSTSLSLTDAGGGPSLYGGLRMVQEGRVHMGFARWSPRLVKPVMF